MSKIYRNKAFPKSKDTNEKDKELKESAYTISERNELSDEVEWLDKGENWKTWNEPLKKNDINTLESLIKKGKIQINPAVHLHRAAKSRSRIVFDTIFTKYPDADVDILNEDKDTPLHIAARNGYLPTIRYLLDKKADPNKKNKLGQSALHLACLNSGEDVIQLLVTSGAQVNQLDNKGRVAAYYAAENGCENIISILANAGVDLDHKDLEGNVALIVSAKNGHTSTMKELIQSGASLDVRDSQGFNALERAIENKRDITAATYIRLNPESDFFSYFADSREISIFKVIKNGLTETIIALLDGMVKMTHNQNINNAVIKTRYLDVDENMKMPDSEQGYDGNKTTMLQRISEVGEARLAYHGVIRILIDHKMKKFGNLVLIYKCISYVLFLLCLAYSLTLAVKETDPFVNYNSRDAYDILRIITEIFVLFYWIINIASEVIEFIRTTRLAHTYLKNNKQINDEREASNDHQSVYRRRVTNLNKNIFRKMNKYLLVRIFVNYFKDKSNYLDLIGISTIGILIILRLTSQPAQWIFATLSFFTNCLRIFKLIKLTPILGPYSIIIQQILKNDVPRFGAMFILTLLLYTGCFFIALRTPYTVMGLTNITLGENTVRIPGVDDKIWWVLFSGFRILMEQNIIEQNFLYQRYNWLAACIYLGYLLIIVIYLNVFIAQLFDTFAITKLKAKIYSASFRLKFIVGLQTTSLFTSCLDLRKKFFLSETVIGKEELEKYFSASSLPAFYAKNLNEDLDVISLISRIGNQQKIGRRSQEISIDAIKNLIKSEEHREMHQIQQRMANLEVQNYKLNQKIDQLICLLKIDQPEN